MRLSTSSWHERVPKDLKANLLFRQSLLTECDRSRSSRAAFLQACSEDLLLYVNACVWQFNPKKKGGGEVAPFISWDYQDKWFRKALWCYENDRDLWCEKSREMGVSWMALILMDWLCRFHRWQKCLVISRNADAVDDRADPDSLFWKLDHIQRFMPAWMGEVDRSKMLIRYPATNSIIAGEASTGAAGVGGRAGLALIDEFPRIREDREVLQGTASTTDTRIFVGTHLGSGTAFYDMLYESRLPVEREVIHWTQHPDKWPGAYRWNPETNEYEVLDKSYSYPTDFEFDRSGKPSGGPFPGVRSPWYDRKCRDIGSARGVAMELDIDPRGATSQFFDAGRVNRLKAECRPPVWVGDVNFDLSTGRASINPWVTSPDGPLKLWFHLDPWGRPPRRKYGFGVDSATGSGATPSCVSILDTSGKKVGQYANNGIPEREFAALITALGWLFVDENDEPATVAIELIGPGNVVQQRAGDLGYRQFWYNPVAMSITGERSEKPGWYPNPESKRLLFEAYRSALQGRQFDNPSEKALDECLEYVYAAGGRGVEHKASKNADDPAAAGANHGDHATADALAWMVIKDWYERKEAAKKEEVPTNSIADFKRRYSRQESESEAWA